MLIELIFTNWKIWINYFLKSEIEFNKHLPTLILWLRKIINNRYLLSINCVQFMLYYDFFLTGRETKTEER